MDLYFCDICNESIPAADLDRGMAFRRGERVVCVACDNSMSGSRGDDGHDQGSGPDALAATDVKADSTGLSAGGGAQGQVAKPGLVLPFWLVASFLLLGLSYLFYTEREHLLSVQAEQQAAIEDLVGVDARGDQRFADFQVTISRADQQQAGVVSTQIDKLRGDSEESAANLRARFGRFENSLESVRQDSDKDRLTLGAAMKGLEAEASAFQKSNESLAEVVTDLRGRLAALEKILEGGLSQGSTGGSSGKASRWAGILTDLKDASAGNRWTAVTALGDTGDAGVVPYLLPMLGDVDVFVRMATARVLGELGSLDAAGALIEALGDAEAAVREAAVVSLRLLTGKDFRFDPLGKDGDRKKAQDTWRKWAGQEGVAYKTVADTPVAGNPVSGKPVADDSVVGDGYGPWSDAPKGVREYVAGELVERAGRYGADSALRAKTCAALIAQNPEAKVYYRANSGREYLYRVGQIGQGQIIIYEANKGIYHRALSVSYRVSPY